MYFKKLELIGFKSFLNKTTLHFESGITAVVGPNGSGKSNLYDAICWVLGEQSAKSLRGSDMQDVIFNGTDAKEPLSMAEVSLTFDNNNRFFNVDHPEVTITRRLFRSGESEYLLNKSLVRLKDIMDLLLGTGIGAESYSLVAQGKIDLVLSSRPEDRRLVFDEASGITKYKAQKREAMRKLEETQANLLRVNDIILEVKRQISSLERQANKARRYKEIFEELKSQEINLGLWQKNNLLRQKDETIKQLEELQAQEIKLAEVIKEQESRISNRQADLKSLEDKIISTRNEILNLDNLILRNKERVIFNQERIKELEVDKGYLEKEIEKAKEKQLGDEEKLNKFKEEYRGIQKNIVAKEERLKEKNSQLDGITLSIKASLENIAQVKKEILDLVSQISRTKNELTDLNAKEQVYLARKRRLELEKVKVNEEKAVVEDELKSVNQELDSLNKIIQELNQKILHTKSELTQETDALKNINARIENLEKEKLILGSHKEFIDKLKTKYQDISESLDAVIYLDKLPREPVSGLVVKIKDKVKLSDEDRAYFAAAEFRLSGEAKPIDLDTQKLTEKLEEIENNLGSLKSNKVAKENRIEELNRADQDLQQELRSQDIALANKKTSQANTQEQFNKIKEEYDLILWELSDLEKELSGQEGKINILKIQQIDLEEKYKDSEDLITKEQNSINLNAALKEKVLVEVTQVKTELEAVNRRISSEEATLKILEDNYTRDKENLSGFKGEIEDAGNKQENYASEIKNFENESQQTEAKLKILKMTLTETEGKYQQMSDGAGDVVKKIELARKELDALKNRLHELEMRRREIDFKFLSIRQRILQAYKVDLEALEDLPHERDENMLAQEIEGLKEKLDSLGTVNLVAIEEYDELKSRYDFLIQQQNDLISAKESLHEAILKINRTTKKMFLETFERVGEEFRNYFKLLFGGGDARLFLIDEQDPLESGIEIICRPPGKKLQNVLLLSGGEKSLSAIALVFAIFKVKPSPFCVLDEIDAALDEANVDRFGRLLLEFSHTSQFIVITHNKRTIVNADVMYGITMEESGVSRIVSVKFAQDKPARKELQQTVAEPV